MLGHLLIFASTGLPGWAESSFGSRDPGLLDLPLSELERDVSPVHAADHCGRVTAMWARIRRW